MTVCIGAVCDNGEHVVTATDGLLSTGDVTSDVIPGKMLWYKDWLFMYAGVPANFNLIIEEIEAMGMDDTDALSRRRIQSTIRTAYRRFSCRFSSRASLDPFDMTMEEFKKTGLQVFGQPFHDELLRSINQQAAQLNEQLLVIGWGHAPHAAMVYEIGPTGEWLHTAAGFAAIGSGSQMAQTMLLLLGQARHSTLSETIFNVACAKFSAEKSSGLDVGKLTTMYVARKRKTEDDASQVCGDFLEEKDIDELRELWNAHLKPRIPDEAYRPIQRIAARLNSGHVQMKDVCSRINAEQRLHVKRMAIIEGAQQYLQSPTADPSHQPPSQESHGDSDES